MNERPLFPTLIWRHRRENLKKCSLRTLSTRTDLCFFTYPRQGLHFTTSDYIVLRVGAPSLSVLDREKGLILIDGTWRLAAQMQKALPFSIQERSLPSGLQTAYPRRQTGCPNPSEGLASIEALYAAYWILGHSVEGLLDGYEWKEEFLEKNRSIFTTPSL